MKHVQGWDQNILVDKTGIWFKLSIYSEAEFTDFEKMHLRAEAMRSFKFVYKKLGIIRENGLPVIVQSSDVASTIENTHIEIS